MLQAYVRLIGIAAAVIIVSIFGLFFMRQMGLQQKFEAPPNPWFQRTFWWVDRPALNELCGKDDFSKKLPTKDWIFELPVERKGRDQGWFVPCPTPVPVADFLAHNSNPDWMLTLNMSDTWSLDTLAKTLHQFDGKKHFGIRAEAQKVSLYLRKQGPEWLFAADQASLLRFRTFESLWIETVLDFWPDFVILSDAQRSQLNVDTAAVNEWARRQKRLLWEWNDGDADPSFAIQGVVTKTPDAAVRKFAK